MEKSPVFGIIGGTFSGNRGAESMLATTIGMLRHYFPNSEYIIFSYPLLSVLKWLRIVIVFRELRSIFPGTLSNTLLILKIFRLYKFCSQQDCY